MKTAIFTAILIILLALILSSISITYLLINLEKNITKPQSDIPILSPAPSPNELERPLPGMSYDYLTESDKIRIKQEEAVSQLIKKIPFEGANFYLEYSFKAGEFTLTLNRDNLAAANQEFDQFLKDNGVAERSWFED